MGSKEFLESIEKLVELNELDACALVHGFSKNRSAIKELKDVAGIEKLKTSAYALLRTEGMRFRPTEEMKIIYSQIAEIELKRLAEAGESGFRCGRGHSLEQHKKSLEEVLSKLKPVVN
ncbi:MAG: hypothetical protein HYT65_03265 [Candidatus Yanofskybacteria bacterium]|nr:hypothetical protein [Candidatus Yanofskybacteria bacterium]